MEYISHIKTDDTFVPLYDLQNVKNMKIEHPLYKNGKPQFFKACEESFSFLLKNKNYVFLRRFSTKDDKKRLIAAPYFMDISLAEYIGLENHLNYIYRPKGNMDRNEVLGIAALLNSEIFDKYFRIINGNINVSATELRALHLPALEQIKKIGNELILQNNFYESNVDEIVNQILGIGKLLEVMYE